MTWKRVALLSLVALVLGIGGFALWIGYEAGQLPFQTDPTRIPITPFANLPTPMPTGTP